MNTGSEPAAVVWHDLESGSAAADISVWERLANEAGGEILELGCGTGRVGLHLARRGHPVVGVDRDAALVEAFEQRAAREGLAVQGRVADARRLHLGRSFDLVIAPQQMIQQCGYVDRLATLRAAAGHLAPGGRAVFAIVEESAWTAEGPAGPDPLPDVREIDDWVFSSRPLGAKRAGRGVVIERLRETVSPGGERLEELHGDHLDALNAERLEQEATLVGLRPAERREIPADPEHAASIAVILEKR